MLAPHGPNPRCQYPLEVKNHLLQSSSGLKFSLLNLLQLFRPVPTRALRPSAPVSRHFAAARHPSSSLQPGDGPTVFRFSQTPHPDGPPTFSQVIRDKNHVPSPQNHVTQADVEGPLPVPVIYGQSMNHSQLPASVLRARLGSVARRAPSWWPPSWSQAPHREPRSARGSRPARWKKPRRAQCWEPT